MKNVSLYLLITLLCFNLIACGREVTSDDTAPTESQPTERALVLESKENLQPYIDLLGAASDGEMEVTQDFIENINSVHVMGVVGSVSHGFSESSISEIDIMDWISNETVSFDEFELFITQLNHYFDYTAELKSYDNISEKTYVWVDYTNSCMVLGWYEDERISIRWNYEVEYVNSLIENSVTQQDNNQHITIKCEVDDCNKEGTFDIVGFSGQTEYYCYTHYREIQDMINDMLNEPSYGDCANCGRPAEYQWDENTAYCGDCYESLLEFIYGN